MLGAYASGKRKTGAWGELLFGCHGASAAIAVGLISGQRWAIALGLVFYVGVGLPSWLIQVAATRTTTAASVAAHLLPPLLALPFAASAGVPFGAGLAAWTMFLCLIALSAAFTRPALNVNLAHGPSPELKRWLSSARGTRAFIATLSLVTLGLADLLLGLALGR